MGGRAATVSIRRPHPLSERLAWSIRVAAPLAAIFVSGGFFGLAHVPAFRVLVYAGAGLIAYSTVATTIGFFRSLR
jgi:hypothetical protein